MEERGRLGGWIVERQINRFDWLTESLVEELIGWLLDWSAGGRVCWVYNANIKDEVARQI